MDRKAPQSVAEVLRKLLEDSMLSQRMEELQAADLWPKVAGRNLAELTSRPFVKNGVMQIGVPNASLRHELTMNRSQLRHIINKTLGKEVITEIRFTT